jgi:hypothetical protein
VRMLARAPEISMEAVPGMLASRQDPAGPPELLPGMRPQADRCRLAGRTTVL